MSEYRRLLTACTIVLLAVAMAARGQDGTFAVASIKLNTSGLPYSQSADIPDGIAFVNEQLRDVILFAFGLYDFQLTGDPAWVSRDRFDIAARTDGPLSLDEKRSRLRRLLADRFGLRVRTEVREQAIYALKRTAAGAGVGLKSRDCVAPGSGGSRAAEASRRLTAA